MHGAEQGLIDHIFPDDVDLPKVEGFFYNLDTFALDTRRSADDLHLGGMLLNVAVVHKQKISSLGSAFLVASGLAMTANHVYEDFVDPGNQNRISKEVLLIGFHTNNSLMIWRVKSANVVGDVALLECDLASPIPKDLRIPALRLSSRSVEIGDDIYMIGFRKKGDFSFDSETITRMHLIKGAISEVYPNGRPLLPGGCFEVSGEALGGMSGGPALNSHGEVVGVISRSLSGGGPSFCSFFTNLLGKRGSTTWPKRLRDKRKVTLYDLTEPPIEVWLTGREHVTVQIFDQPPMKFGSIVNVSPWR